MNTVDRSATPRPRGLRTARPSAGWPPPPPGHLPGIDPTLAFMPYPPANVMNAHQGPLAGLSFGVKDLFDVAGYPTAAGNPVMLAVSGVRDKTAPAVQRLLDAGARFAGKTQTDELSFSISGRNCHFGTPVNGAAPGRIPGGSSSGSASAVSTGLCDFALGTDTGGSSRVPASHCGLFGLRPTHARISLDGCVPLCTSFDAVGYFARDGAVFERVGDVLLGPDTRPLPQNPPLWRAADAFEWLDGPVRQALAPSADLVQAVLGPARDVRVAVDPDADALFWAFRHLQGREAWLSDGPFIERYSPPLGPGVAERFAWSREVSDDQVAQARRLQRALRVRLTSLLKAGAVLMLPTMPDIAPRLDEDEHSLDLYRNRAMRLLCWASLAGLPQVSIPLARRLGAPLGLSLIGPAGSDLSLVRLAARIWGAGAP